MRHDPLNRQRPGVAPDYTAAFLVSFGMCLFVGLIIVWALWGFAAAVICGVLGDRLIAARARQ